MVDEELPLPDAAGLRRAAHWHTPASHTRLDPAATPTTAEPRASHAKRTPVVTLLSSRLEQLEHGASPSPGSHKDMSEVAEHKRSGSPRSGPSR